MVTAIPVWLAAARKKLGTREAPGAANSPTIMGWAKRLGTKVLGMVYNADSDIGNGGSGRRCFHRLEERFPARGQSRVCDI